MVLCLFCARVLSLAASLLWQITVPEKMVLAWFRKWSIGIAMLIAAHRDLSVLQRGALSPRELEWLHAVCQV